MQSLNLYVRDKRDEKVYVTLHPATPLDIEATKSDWQTYWGTEYLEDPKFLKYAAKTDAGELVGLVAYEISDHYVAVYIPYMEASPESNPTITENKKYYGIAPVFIANAIKLSAEHGFMGDVVFEAKTDALAEYYEKQICALPLPSFGGPRRYMLADEAALGLQSEYI